ncbi:MAG: response regulator [Sumerlaeia bacterium]
MSAQIVLRVVLVDDEPLARERLRRLLEKTGGTELLGEAANGREALTLIEKTQPDVVLLDINMPDIDGFRVLQALDDPPAVIFSTAYDEHAVRAFELEAVDYLLKPYSSERLGKALDRARRTLMPRGGETRPEGEACRIACENGLEMEFVPAARVVCARIEEGVVFVIRDDGESLTCGLSLQELEERVPAGTFFRVSRQAIVNLGAIEAYSAKEEGGLELRLKGGHSETVTRRRARHLRGRMG